MLVILIVLACLLAISAAVVLTLVVVRRAARTRGAELGESFPDAEMGPELGQYRGGTGAFPRVRNTGWIALTTSALVVRPLLGNTLTVPTAEITDTRVEKSFNGHWNGRPVLVVRTALGEIGVTVARPEEWRTALVR